ncbi:hypothetical protein FEE95_13070 [Maribacter algarum]|uniref:Adhesin domain-containing protein n=1 Tax=Maribacter algarum (ex Zhang et al. 2020) TaxID=2578118 RepID=A0A5S3PRP2_9FLAO|nr:hypothetical protein [Maribacter algarum]TMM57410.1 hypothetical protein FEE95_13070 [Maribacter algarum]
MDTLCKKLLWVALVMVLGQSVTAQEKVSKKITKTYAMTDAGKLNLENKYGNITINGWDKNEVSVAISIEVNHRKKENAEALLKRIQPIARDGEEFVSLGYEILEKKTGWFARLIDEANPFDYDRSNIQIDYTIYMPAKAELKITNTFGDVLIEDWTGKLKALIEHGDVWLSEDLNKADFTMRYGKLRAQNISYGSVDIKNGELDIRDSKSLRLNSNGSDIAMDAVTSLEIYSNKDNISMNEVSTMFGTLKFSTLELDYLTKEADMTLKIADFRVGNITNSDVNIAINQESSEISLNVTDFSHQFDATLEQGLVRMPKSFDNIDSKMLDKGKKLREIKATYGNSTQGRISIRGKKGVVLLKEL